jgi:hypothetical protein
VLPGVLSDEAIEVLFEGTRHFARAPRPRMIHETCHALVRQALHPFSSGGVGKVASRRDSVDVVASDHRTDGWRTPKDAGLLGLLPYSL